MGFLVLRLETVDKAKVFEVRLLFDSHDPCEDEILIAIDRTPCLRIDSHIQQDGSFIILLCSQLLLLVHNFDNLGLCLNCLTQFFTRCCLT